MSMLLDQEDVKRVTENAQHLVIAGHESFCLCIRVFSQAVKMCTVSSLYFYLENSVVVFEAFIREVAE